MVFTCLNCTYFHGGGTCDKGWQIEELARGCGVSAAIPIEDPNGNKVSASTCSEFENRAEIGKK